MCLMSLSAVGPAWGCRAEPTLPSPSGDPSAVKKPLVLSPGSAIRLEARVDFSPGVSLKISVDQCHGTSSEQLGRSRRIFMVVNSQGSVPMGREAGTAAAGTPRSCEMPLWGGKSRAWRRLGTVPVLLSWLRCLHGQKLGTVSIQHRRGVSALQLTIPAPLLEDETEEEEVSSG